MLPLQRAAAVALFFAVGCGARTGLPVDGDGSEGGFPGSGGNGASGGGGSSPLCGNGVLDPGEECDGSNLGGVDCTAFGFVDPVGLSCENCLLVDDECGPTCGNFVLEPGEGCDDGNLTSGDGCSATCFAEEDACMNSIPITLSNGTTFLEGELTGIANYSPLVTESCPAGLGGGPEAVYAVSVTEQGHVTAYLPSAANSFNTILYSRLTCSQQSSQLSCNDNDAGAGSGEVITSWLEPGEVLFIFVDTGGAAVGTYQLQLDLSRGGVCGDPVPITVEGTRPIALDGRISSLADDAQASGCSDAGVGPDAVFELTFSDADDYQLEIETSAFDSVAHLRSSCEDPFSEIACDSPNASDNAAVSLSANAGQTRFLWVDSFVMAQGGPYKVTVTH
jgi:cysteine-rich repeat protein